MEEPQELRNLILNCVEPFIIKQKLNWEILKWNLEDWQSILRKDKLPFRCGTKSFTKEPQWERKTILKYATFEEFLMCSKSDDQNWMYFDYKYLREWFNSIQSLKESIQWENFGFPEFTAEDSTIWIGSAEAHTPCHVDTYGCNLIAQVYGRKLWILFPPDEDLKPTRIPYEESSIYSKLNMYSPTIKNFKGIKHCRKVILEPGDVLCVPHKWWHYVENLDVAISVNIWLPLPVDDEERLKESLVQFFISQVANQLDHDTKQIILNPNSDEGVEGATLSKSLDLVNECKTVCMKNQEKIEDVNNAALLDCLKKYSFLHKIPELSDQEFSQQIEHQRNRFNSVRESAEIVSLPHEIVDLINAFTHSDTISLIKNKLFQ